jgi:choice-of-anchor C domain-containing protein
MNLRNALSALAFCAAVSIPCSAGLIVNGGFESSVIVPTGGFEFQHVPNGSAVITNWTVGLTGVDLVGSTLIPVFAGNQAVDMNGTPGPGSISQTITTVNGVQYSLTFYLSSNIGPFADSIQAEVTGNAPVTYSSPAQGTWTAFTYNFVGTGGAQTVTFTSVGGTTFNGALIDNVDVNETNAIPEPSTFGLLGAGLVLAGVVRRKIAR